MEQTVIPNSTHALIPGNVLVGIYRITGPDRVYIGSSDVIPRRFKQHLSQLRGNRHHNYRLQAAWNEHGEAAFTFEAIEEVLSLDDLISCEQAQLNAALMAGQVYNLALDVSTPARGHVHTAESRAKMSAAIRASMTPEILAAKSERVRGEGNPVSKLTEALVLDICQRLMASTHPAEIAAEFEVDEGTIYQIRSGRIWTHIVTPATVETMMAIRQNGWDKRTVTDEHRERMRALGLANTGRIASAETRAKIAEHSRGEANPNARLTGAQAAQIKGLLDAMVPHAAIAEAFGVSLHTVSRISTGESWPDTAAAPVAAEWEHLLAIPHRQPATEEHRAAISAALTGKPKSAEHRANLWANREVTPQMREQMAANGRRNAGRPKSEQTRARMSAAQENRTVLTEEIVRDIKRLLAAGEISGSAIGRKFGITPGAVSAIKQGRNWAHVTI